ncbi:hypothetical protein JAAARDRAFT_59907 [Jaapia argillacea MUCL 33604]|uniref:Cupin type-1 domain-containing protein n=1 Tax=Jaapia argillacea MUCL 33604 TaxID=933084 RepID=A0A067PYI0_9AGAM|nr:hypothetical protein JAAARDRAFT_59907 [Jaapia argillacea MUCL 33604]
MLTPLSSLKVTKHHIPRHALIPNSSITSKPLYIYHGAFTPPPSTSKSQFKSTVTAHLKKIGVIEPQWTYTMYSISHFHSTTHEVLVILSGSARLLFGGEDNPGKVETVVKKGDVIVHPAGVSHRLLEDLRGEGGTFEMLGCYPVGGQQWDMFYGREGEEGVWERIGGLGWFERDPVYGDVGPVLED